MKNYWFYGIMPKDAIPEETLTEEQQKIVIEQKNILTKENLTNGWLGYYKKDKWVFMRHGFEEISIDDPRGNIAREKFEKLLPELFNV